MVSMKRACLAAAALLAMFECGKAAQVPIQGVHLFNGEIPPATTNRADVLNAIDSNLSSFSYLTPSGAIGGRMAGLDLGGTFSINRLQVDKFSANVDAKGTLVDPMDLQILYTTGTGPLSTRTYL